MKPPVDTTGGKAETKKTKRQRIVEFFRAKKGKAEESSAKVTSPNPPQTLRNNLLATLC